ncbi:maleylacetate reductase [Falsiroseomonas sp.]|uniref:maleylacetate reductase n=1 Tax=Falsiroseomonas sp. TaxID=2870721 RepID=UPI0035620835
MHRFTYNGLPSRVVFGQGTLANLPAEVDRLGLRRVLVLATPQQEADARALAERLGGHAAGIFAGAVMHTPVEVSERAVALARELGADGTVAIGGGSTIGLGKAIALRTDLPQIAVPTTYAGSEMTTILGETAGGEKRTQRTLKVLPEVVIYDVDLTLSLPAALSATSGLNAIAHAVEALYAPDGNPVVSLMAEEAIGALARGLPRVVAMPRDVEARSEALYGAWLCGAALGSVAMGLHHKLCHVLGGSFGLPHAETHAVVLPHATGYNAAGAPAAMQRIARALGADDAARGLHELAQRIGAPIALRELGLRESDLDRAADIAARDSYPNPRPIERDAIRKLLGNAWAGNAPG